MKKKILLAAIILSSSTVKLFAQDSSAKPVKTGNEWKMPGDAIKRSQDFAGKLKKALLLNDETTKKVFQAYLANTKPVDEIRILSKTEKEKTDKLKANQSAFNETLKGILSAEQYSNYLKMPSK